jgi:microcystin degradation protein MlrC
MLAHADAVTAYRTFPHVDFRATGERAAALVLAGGGTVRTLAKVAALIPPTDCSDAVGPFAEILGRARRLEALPGVLDVGVYPVQPWMDIGELGTAVVITSSVAEGMREEAGALAQAWYAQRGRWRAPVLRWDAIRESLRTRGNGPWILVDSADATTGGSDGTSAEAIARLEGATLVFSGEGRYRARGRAYTGQEFSMGAAAVLSAGRLRIVLSSRGALGADPAFYECLGLDPEGALAVLVKSQMGWRAGYGAPAERGLVFDGPGGTSLDFSRLPYTGSRRDLFPLSASPPNPVSLWQSN